MPRRLPFIAPFSAAVLTAVVATATGCSSEIGEGDPAGVDVATGAHPAALGGPIYGPVPVPTCWSPQSPYQLPPKAGDVDKSFGCAGVSTYSQAGVDVQVRAIAVQADDKIVAVGETYDPAMNNHDVWVARFTADGKLDGTFATAGVFRHDFTAPLGGAESAEAVVIQPDGRIVLGGGYWREDNSERTGFLMRLGADGALDDTFGSGGSVLTSGMTYVRAMRLQANGTIAAAGEACSPSCLAALGRFSGVDGAPDAGFGSGGYATTSLGGSSNARAYGAAVSGNDVVIGGTTKGATPGSDVGLARYTTALDPSFGSGGTKRFDDASTEAVRGIAPIGTGFILAESATSGGAEQFAVARINSVGSPVASFGSSGRVVDAFAGHGSGAQAVVVTPASQVIAVGYAKDSQQRNRIAVARLTSTGQLDTTFSTDGNVMLSASGTEAYGTSVVLQSTGRIVVGGWSRASADGKRRAVLVRMMWE